MDAIYYTSGVVMMLTLIGFIAATILFLTKPHLLQKLKRVDKPVSRTTITMTALMSIGVTMLLFGSVMAATEPTSVKQERAGAEAANIKAREDKERAAEERRKLEEEAKKPIVKTETVTEVVHFGSTTKEDKTLAKGKTRIAIKGVDGERTITYEVTYIQGHKTARQEIKNEITKKPIAQVTQIGTYVAPVSRPTPVPSPSSTPAPRPKLTPAPTPQSHGRVGAVCVDGRHSSATGRGACSHHGGVARWLYG